MTPEQLSNRAIEFAMDLLQQAERRIQLQNQHEIDLHTKYVDIIAQQRERIQEEFKERSQLLQSEYDNKLATLKAQLEKDAQAALQLKLQEEREQYESKIQSELSSQAQKFEENHANELSQRIALLQSDHVQQQLALQKDIQYVQEQLKVFQQTITDVESLTGKSTDVHNETASLLALESALSKPHYPFEKELNAVKNAHAQDGLCLALVNSLQLVSPLVAPPTVSELRYRFKVVRQEIRREALAPPHMGGIVGSAIGSILATISTAPDGYIEGTGIEERLARVDYYLEQEQLGAALREISTLDGYSATLASDWLSLAQNRLIVNQTVSALRANNVLNHLSVVGASK